MSNGLPLKIKLKKKRELLYPKMISLRLSEDHKAKYAEMSDAKFEVSDSCREALEPVIDALYEEFKRNG